MANVVVSLASLAGTLSYSELALNLASYSHLAGAIFALVAILQLLRAVAGWPVMIGRTEIPVWASWIAFVIAGLLAWFGLTAS